MTFAYLILAHKNPGQVLRLVKALSTANTCFFIHIDRKVDETPFKSVITGDNIFFCKNRKIVNWGGFSMIEATMELIGEMAENIGFPDYVHLLSGQDFPLKSNEYIFNYFEQNRGNNFLEYFSLPDSNWNRGGMDRISYEWRIDEFGYSKASELANKQQPRDFLPDTVPYGGSQWWSLTGECVSEIFDNCKQGSKLYEFYRFTLYSDEMLFHTFILNSKYKDTVVNRNLRKIDWKSNGAHPKLWKSEDFYELIATPELFARKFDENIDNRVLEKLEARIAASSTNSSSTNNTNLLTPATTPCPLQRKGIVSVVMPVYNAEKYLPESIESVLSQTFRNFELIIVDDGSEDHSIDVIKGYDDERIKLIMRPHNFIDSLNAGMEAAKGKYIARMDADDIMTTERLEVQFEYMETHPEIDVCGSWASYFGTVNNKIRTVQQHTDIACTMMFFNTLIHPTSIIRRESMLRHNLKYKHEYAYAEDYKLWTDFLMHGCKLANIPYFLLNYRWGENTQVTISHGHEMCIVAERVKQEYCEYVLNRLRSEGDDVRDFLNKLNERNRPDKMLQIIQSMYRNLLNMENKQNELKLLLTVVIPFLNEGEEVERTVQSIRRTAGENVEILLINDASQDDTDYENVAKNYNTGYIKNDVRKGVAQSRDLGVSMINTPYFILMDAHMRFYKDNWWSEAVKYLEQDDRAVYCLKCLALDDKGEVMKDRFGTGAYIKLDEEPWDSVLDPAWISSNNSAVFDIPCIFGASYIMSKRYWDYLKGLNLLRYYGSDETYLSLKVWLEGGSCKLIPNVEAGHKFRSVAPYSMVFTDLIYNKLMIAETVLPEDFARYVHSCMRNFNQSEYFFALSLLNRQRNEISKLKEYYKSIFTRDFSFFKELNKRYCRPRRFSVNNLNSDMKIDEIAQSIVRNQPAFNGLMAGNLGELVFLCKYAKYKKNPDMDTHIKTSLDAVLKNVVEKKTKNFNLATGLVGEGIGLMYLKNKGYIDMDISDILLNIDSEIFGFVTEAVEKQNFGYLQGLAGVGNYFIRRNFPHHLNHLISGIALSLANIEKFAMDMPQGILGVLLFLISAYDKTADREKAYNIIHSLVSCILSSEQDFRKTDSYFVENPEKPCKTGLIWQSGDLITGYILRKAAKILDDNGLHDKSMRILLSTTERLDPVRECVWDAGFYHGSSGTAYLYHKLYRKTGEIAFKNARDYWFEETLYKAVVDNDTAGYKVYDSSVKENNRGLMAGIAGIGLTLLSIGNESDLLDDFFMLND
jgi:glycosyltransferase involved in cell wall biosynthesis